MKPLLTATLCHRDRLLTETISETIGDLQSAMSILLFTCYKLLVASEGSSNHLGWTAMDTSFHRGWLVSEQRVHCDLTVSTGGFIPCIELRLSFAPCMCAFSIVRCIICFVVASFALWFCHCAILLSILVIKGDDDIKIQRRHTKLELKRQCATTDRWAAGTEATELFSAEFHPNVALTNTKWSGKNSSTWWLVWHMALCTQLPLSFWLLPVLNGKRENSFRWKIEGRSGENCGIQFFFLVFSSFRTVCDYLKLKQQQRLRVRKGWLCSSKKNLAPVLLKNRFGFCKTGSAVGKISQRLWENQPPTLGKWATDFGKMGHWLWEAAFLRKNRLCFLGKKRLRLRLWHKVWENWFGFWIGLGQSSSLTVLNA